MVSAPATIELSDAVEDLSASQNDVDTQPLLPSGVTQAYLPCIVDKSAAIQHTREYLGEKSVIKDAQLMYEAKLLGVASVRFVDQKRAVNTQKDVLLLVGSNHQLTGIDWTLAERLPLSLGQLRDEYEMVSDADKIVSGDFPKGVSSARDLVGPTKELANWLYDNEVLTLTVQRELDMFRLPDKDELSFRNELQKAAEKRRDSEIDALKSRAEAEQKRIDEKLAKEKKKLKTDESRARSKWMGQLGKLVKVAQGFLMGRSVGRSISSASNNVDEVYDATMSVGATKQSISSIEAEKFELQKQLEADIDATTKRWEEITNELVEESIKPRRSDIVDPRILLAWTPVWLIRYDGTDGEHTKSVAAYNEL